MDSDLIYVKTALGDEAMRQRTQVMQRNVRMVLILVDGHSTVADLSAKTSNSLLTENALRELEKGGFIELRGEQDSLWEESKKVAQEIRAAAIEQISVFSLPAAKNFKPPPPPTPENRSFVHSVFPVSMHDDMSLSQISLAPKKPSLDSPGNNFPPFPWQKNTEQEAKKPSKVTDDLPHSSFIERLKSSISGALEKERSPVSIKPIRRNHSSSMGWLGIVISVICGFFALVVLALVLFPYDSYLPKVEAAFTQASGKQVKVRSMHLSAYPKPALLLADVRIGSGKDEIRIAEMQLQPVIGTLTAAKTIFRDVVLSGVTLPAEMIAGLPSVFSSAAKPASGAGVEHVRFEKTDVSFVGLGFSGMEGEVQLSAGGLFQSLSLRSADRSLSLEAKPVAQRLDVSLEGFAWRPVQNSPFLFDSANMKGSLENGVFTIRSMELRLFDGLIQGVAVLQANTKPSLSGEIVFERINAARLGDALGIGQQFIGETAGKLRFSMTDDSWHTIFGALNAEGTFAMHRGSVRGIDLAEAVRRVSRTPVQGGATVFEQLSGKIKLTPTNYQFSGLMLSSGLMQSTGFVDVSKDLKLSGKMELQMRGSVNQTRVPISIGGPLKMPVVQVGGN